MRALLPGLFLSLALCGGALAQQSTASALSQLHGDLRLTAEQEPGWSEYAATMESTAQMQARRQAAELMLPQLATPRRLALIEAAMTQELADFHQQSQVINVFYARLTPSQQRTFDRETLPSQRREP